MSTLNDIGEADKTEDRPLYAEYMYELPEYKKKGFEGFVT